MRRAFTLIEMLVVIAIIAVLAGLLFPVFFSAKKASQASDCISNIHQIGLAASLYASDYDDRLPQTKPSSSNPAFDDIAGGREEPDLGPAFPFLEPYTKANARLLTCPNDPDPTGQTCLALNPDVPDMNSYLWNGSVLFGFSTTEARSPSSFILFAERRSEGTAPFCSYLYHPWFNSQNPLAPGDEMNAQTGAVSTTRHQGLSEFGFADLHVKALAWGATYDPASGRNWHVP